MFTTDLKTSEKRIYGIQKRTSENTTEYCRTRHSTDVEPRGNLAHTLTLGAVIVHWNDSACVTENKNSIQYIIELLL